MDRTEGRWGLARREALLERVERLTELPLLLLAFVMVPLVVAQLFWDLPAQDLEVVNALSMFIWATFTADLGVKTVIAPDRLRYLRRQWLDVLIVVLPFFRPLRLLRLFVYGTRAVSGFRRMVRVDFLFVYGLGLILISATIVTSVERNVPGANIQSFPDALWWAVVTITTVGYGDKFPITAMGRGAAFVLMLGGIAFFSGVTANLASFLVRGEDKPDAKEPQATTSDLVAQIEELRKEVRALKAPQGAGSAETPQDATTVHAP